MIQALLPIIGSVLDRVLPDEKANAEAKQRITEMAFKGEMQQLENDMQITLAKAGIIKAEAASQHWLAANWRPLLMLTFGGLIVARWFGWAAPNLAPEEYIALWDIVELGIGGYVIGRSVEKVTPALAYAYKNRKK
mgnify:CR=1 FL=1